MNKTKFCKRSERERFYAEQQIKDFNRFYKIKIKQYIPNILIQGIHFEMGSMHARILAAEDHSYHQYSFSKIMTIRAINSDIIQIGKYYYVI